MIYGGILTFENMNREKPSTDSESMGFHREILLCLVLWLLFPHTQSTKYGIDSGSMFDLLGFLDLKAKVSGSALQRCPGVEMIRCLFSHVFALANRAFLWGVSIGNSSTR